MDFPTGGIIGRTLIQIISFIFAIGSVAVLAMMIYKHVVNWRYCLVPLFILAQIILYYAVVFQSRHGLTETLTDMSALIRNEIIVSFFFSMLIYWYFQNKRNEK